MDSLTKPQRQHYLVIPRFFRTHFPGSLGISFSFSVPYNFCRHTPQLAATQQLPYVQQAVADVGINLEDYGRKGKDSTRLKAAPEEELEPVLATPTIVAGAVAAPPAGCSAEVAAGAPELLVDTGAGSHLFQKGFDPAAVPGKSFNRLQFGPALCARTHTHTRTHAAWSFHDQDGRQYE